MADPSKALVTSDDPRLTASSVYPVGIRDLGDGTGMMVLSNGSEIGPVAPLAAIPGPPNTLTIGTVTSGSTASATITGTAPHQVLNLVTKTGETGPAPTVSWSGARLTVGGQQGPDLTSTVPGPTGRSAYEAAKLAGYTGTETEFNQATVPTSVSWANLADKPTAFPPAAHKHALVDVTGLGDALATKAATTDPRFTDNRFPTTHTHTQQQVDGLADVLAILTRDTGWLTDPTWWAWETGWASRSTAEGAIWKPVVMRVKRDRLIVNGLTNRTGAATSAGAKVATISAASGFRPTRSFISGNLRFDADGSVTCNEAVGASSYVALYGECTIG